MAKQTTEAIITLNGKQPIEVLNQMHSAAEKIKAEMEQVQQKMKGMSPKDDAYKQLNGSLKKLKGQYDLLSSAQVKDIEATQRLQAAVDNLASTSLKNLRKALGDGKRQIEGLSEAELEQANTIRSLMKTVGDQVRLLEGKFVKIREGLASIGTQSDQWLGKAIAQQQELMAVTRRGTKEYKEQEQVMQMLTAEQNKRNAAIAAEATARRQAQFKQQVASSRQMLSSGDLSKYSSSDVQTSINTLKQAQSQAAMGGSEWQRLAAEIKKAEDELDRLLGKTKEVKQQMSEGDARSILGNIGGHTEQEVREAINALKLLQSTVNVGGNQWNAYAADIEKAETELGKLTGRVKEAKQGLSMNDVESRMQNLNAQSERSLKEMLDYLQKAKAELNPYTQQWKNLATQIDAVKNRMADVQASSPYVRNYESAQFIARNDRKDWGNGNTFDVTRKDLQWSKEFLQKQLDVTPVADTAKIQEIQEALGLIEQRMNALDGAAKKSAMSTEKLNEVLGNIKTASLEELRDASAELKRQLNGLAPSSNAAKQIKKHMQDLDREIKQVEDDMVDVNDVIARSKNGKASISELKKAYKQLEDELNHLATGSKEFTDKRKDFEALRDKIEKVTVSAHKQGGAWQTALKNLTAYVGLFGAFNMIKSKLTDVLKLNFQYSDSLANVRKVSNLSMDSVNDLSRMLAKVDSRTSLEGLTQLAYVGSRMGMGKYGAEGLAEFAQASDRVNVALKEDLGDDAMLTLSKFVETMGEVEKHGGNISSAFDAVSSSIFKLASTSTANGNNILEFAKRLTGLSKVSHITSYQLLGLASASDSLMLMPEVASTAFGKLISSLWTNYHEIEKMLGMQEDSLKGMMEKGQTMEALVTILENVSDKNLNSMDAYFKEFGSDGQRLKQVVVTMAQNVGVLKSHLQESSEAYEDATAVQKEYAIQQETAQALLERANNMWSKAFVNPEGIDVMKEIAKAWYDFSKTLTQSTPFMVSVKILLWGIKTSFEALLAILPGLVLYLGTRGLVWAFSKLIPLMTGISGSGIVSFFYLLTLAVTGNSAAVRLLKIRWKELNLAMKANVIGLAISLVAELGVWIYSLVKKTDDATESVDRFNKSLDGVQKKANQAQGELDAYYNAIRNAKKGSKEYSAAMKVYNDKFGQYFKNLKKENGAVLDLAESYRQASRAIQAKIYLESMQEDRDKYLKPRAGWALDRLGEYGKVAPAGFGTSVLKGFEEDNRSKSMSYIIGTLAKRFGSKHAAAVLASIKRGDKEATTRTAIYNNSMAGGYTTEVKQKMAPEDQQLFYALRYILQARSAHNTEKKINKKYAPVQGEMTDYVNSLSNDGETLGGGTSSGGTGTGHHDTKDDKLRKQEQQAQTRANALVSNIKAFYEEQKRKYLEWVTTMNADGEKVSEGQQQQMLDYIDTRMSTALGKAKQSIATNSAEWEKFLQDMPEKDMMVETDETSKDLIEAMKGSNIKELHDLFEKLSGDLSKENHQTLSENLGALLDQIFANGSKELREAAEKLLAQQREIQKILNENDYTGAVNRDTRSNFDKLGFLKPAKDVRADSESGLQQMNESFDALTTKARTSVAELYKLNPASDTFKSDFLEYLSVANEGFDFSTLNVQKLKALYYELIKYTESYTEAEKRQYDKAKKIIDFDWSKKARNKEVQDRIKLIEAQQKMYGKQSTFKSNLGLSDIKDDPEIALMKARMQAAEDYYAFVKLNTDNQKLRDEAERARQEAELAYMSQVAASMKERLSQMKGFVQPIEDFGSAVGQALATMKNDAKSANEAIKSALKSMLESWGKMALDDVSKQMWQAINNAGVNRAKEKAVPDIAVARQSAEKAAANGELSFSADLGTPSNPMYVHVVNGQPVDANGNPVAAPLTPTGDVVSNPDGSKGVPPSPGTTKDFSQMTYNPASGQDQSSVMFKDTASQAGSSVADVATGKSSLGEAAVGMAGGALGTIMNTDFGSKQSRREKSEQRKQQREAKKHQKELTKEAKKGVNEREKINKKGNKEITKSTEEESKAQVKTEELKQNTTNAIVDASLNTNFKLKKDNDKKVVEQSKDTANAENTFSIVGAVGKCFEYLGPIAGPIAAAAVMALLTGLMQWGLNAAFGGNKNKNNSSSGPNTKLVSGMLTYDSGNVQDMKPFVGDNGEIYWAREQDKPKSGVNLLTTPTATTINGQRALVAENGPELVIGRETTKAMMMNNPSLLKALVNYDANYSGRNAARRAFDEGNLAEALGNLSSGASATDGLIADSRAANIALITAINTLMQRLDQPIHAKIDMYGRGNLYDSMSKANQFMKGKS